MVHKCPMCRKEVTTNSIACSICDLWIHKACTGMSNDLFKLLLEIKEQGQDHCWKCEPCGSARKIIDQRLTNLEKTVNKIQETVTSNVENIAANKDKVDKAVEQIEKIEESVKELKSSKNEDAAKSMIAEQIEQNLKKLNIIIHNLKEPATNLTSEERKHEDQELLARVLGEIQCVVNPDADIKFSTRIGRVNSENSNPRPLLVGLKYMEKKTEILEKMKTSSNKPVNYISIVPDLTKLQRKVEDDLRKEADQLNKDMSEDDFLVWEWKVLGWKGEKRLVKTRKRLEDQPSKVTQGKGQGRPPKSVNQQVGGHKRKTRSGDTTEGLEEQNPSKK